MKACHRDTEAQRVNRSVSTTPKSGHIMPLRERVANSRSLSVPPCLSGSRESNKKAATGKWPFAASFVFSRLRVLFDSGLKHLQLITLEVKLRLRLVDRDL